MLTRLAFITFVLIFSLKSYAKLPQAYFEDLLAETELIVYGEVFSITYNKDYSGTANIRVIEVLSGDYQDCHIEYSWTNSQHSRDIDRAAQRYVIFIKKEGGRYISSVHGAGVWIVYLNTDDFNKSVVVNDFIDTLPDNLFEQSKSDNDHIITKKITLDSLRRFFKSKEHSICSNR